MIKNCKVENADVRGSANVGGLVGYFQGKNKGSGPFIEGCSVTNCMLWITSLESRSGDYNSVGSIAGLVSGEISLKNCTASGITYKVGTQATEGAPYIIEGGKEGQQEYGPTHALYGYSDNPGKVTIEND